MFSWESVHHTNVKLAFRAKALIWKTGWDGNWPEILVRELETEWYLGQAAWLARPAELWSSWFSKRLCLLIKMESDGGRYLAINPYLTQAFSPSPSPPFWDKVSCRWPWILAFRFPHIRHATTISWECHNYFCTHTDLPLSRSFTPWPLLSVPVLHSCSDLCLSYLLRKQGFICIEVPVIKALVSQSRTLSALIF